MDAIAQAFKIIQRENFVPESLRNQVSIDAPLPIGYGQTNSQLTTVRLMLEWLEVEPGNTILDIGSGSGWTTALLSHLTGPTGRVYAVEKIPELVEMGRTNCAHIGVKNASFYQAEKEYGLSAHRPYDRILVSAAANTLPVSLLEQLKVGGKLVVPVKHAILEITKSTESDFSTITHDGFAFVPLVSGKKD